MEVVRTSSYRKDVKRLGLTDDEQAALERAIAVNPEAGDVLKGLKGVRKIRFAMGGRGKRGGGRAIYLVLFTQDRAILLRAYAKNEQDDLSTGDRKAIAALLKEIGND